MKLIVAILGVFCLCSTAFGVETNNFSLLPFYGSFIDFNPTQAKYKKDGNEETKSIDGKYLWNKKDSKIVEIIKTKASKEDGAAYTLDESGKLDRLVTCMNRGCQAVTGPFCQKVLTRESENKTGLLRFMLNGYKLNPDEIKKCQSTLEDIRKVYEQYRNLENIASEGMDSINQKAKHKFEFNFSKFKTIEYEGVLFERYLSDRQACDRFEGKWSTAVESNANKIAPAQNGTR